ncbi:Uncharacterised protein [Lactiplantibacillus plantarum]|nr:Uncharacterised protein [Lactiplantibacillus plantarum]
MTKIDNDQAQLNQLEQQLTLVTRNTSKIYAFIC